MDQLISFIQNHQVIVGGALALAASAGVRALPEPAPLGNQFYGWFYRFTHLLMANFDLAKGKK